MNPPWLLVAWMVRRSWPPSVLLLLAAALGLALGLPWSAGEGLASAALSADIEAGLARQGVWTLGAGLVLAWLVARAALSVRAWRRGEGDWLATSRLSRAGVALALELGLGIALALGLLPFALAAEWRAGGQVAPLRWLGESTTPAVVLLEDGARAEFALEIPRRAQACEARFVVAAPGEGGPTALLRATLTPQHGEPRVQEVRVSTASTLLVDLQDLMGTASLRFERIGPGAAVVLENRRLVWLSGRSSWPPGAAALFLHAWLAGSAAAVIALALAAWASAGTAFLAAFATLVGAWLSADVAPWIPGVGLREALGLCGDGHAPGWPSLAAWLCVLALHSLALLAVEAQRDLWRREA